MKAKIFKWSLLPSIGFLLLGTFGLTACNGDLVQAASVRLNKSQITMDVGGVEELKATVTKGYASELRWFSSNESVAYADDGYVFGTGEGEAIITASYGGGYASCKVTVTDGGEGPESGKKLNISPVSQSVKVGETFTLTVTAVEPADTTVTFTPGDTSVATITPVDGKTVTVFGNKVGSTGITVAGSNGMTRVCQVSVYDNEGPTDDYNIAVDSNLKLSGAISIGSPKNQRTFMEGLLRDFNSKTNSSVSFTIIDFEEDNGTSNYTSASSMPAVFPYASDQTMTLFQFDALNNVSSTDVKWIKENMGPEAADAATYNNVVGYPFAADNGLVMFYNKQIVKEADLPSLRTMNGILDLAARKELEVNYPLSNGFYLAPALMSYNGGEPLYELTPGDGKNYQAASNFNSDNGLRAAKELRNFIAHPWIRNATDAPRNDVLVTITDSSKVESFKKTLGTNYAVAPLPYIDDAETTRLGSFLGYKFYGVNLQLTKAQKTIASNVAKFLCSEYCQYRRYMEYNVRPTLKLEKLHTDFREAVVAEPHIAALTEQSLNHGVIPMRAVSSSLWSQTMVTYTELKKLSASASDAAYREILKTLDSGLKK